ncbi:hypothetical protein DPMN_176172 [Dreissena polymorpha]|uniref:Uncharacterized protein n=1 Tax=Dreissena polymorpha TaxID=45954 RepID=A0A9D4E9F6_DREPO|nr:hypothetical protein DPMN_176172 [Dreissena polymorpha]
MTVFTIYKVGVSDALSTWYLVLGSNEEYASNDITHVLSVPLETENGNTTFDLQRTWRFRYNNYLNQPQSIDVDYGRKQM